MAEKQEHRTKLNQRVRIKDTMTHLCPNARAYNEGFVRKQIHDDYGYPLIYVEWDKDHWAYSGEQDRVVLEAHFDPVEEDMSEEKDLRELMEALLERLNSGEASEPKEDSRPDADDYTYDKVLGRAMQDASEGEAYIVLVAAQESHGDTELLVPHIYLHSKSDESALMLEAAVADHVAQTMIRLAQEVGRSKRHGPTGS